MTNETKRLLLVAGAVCLSIFAPSAALLLIASVCAFIGYVAPRGEETLSSRLTTHSVLKLVPLLLALWVPYLIRVWLF